LVNPTPAESLSARKPAPRQTTARLTAPRPVALVLLTQLTLSSALPLQARTLLIQLRAPEAASLHRYDQKGSVLLPHPPTVCGSRLSHTDATSAIAREPSQG